MPARTETFEVRGRKLTARVRETTEGCAVAVFDGDVEATGVEYLYKAETMEDVTDPQAVTDDLVELAKRHVREGEFHLRSKTREGFGSD